MAFNGGNADFFEGYIYWATSSNGVDWVVHDLNAADGENWTPLLSRNNREDECPPALGAFHEPKLTYNATDTSMGSSGTFSLFTSYCHYQSGGQDPCLVRDTWLFRFGYNPAASTGLGSTLQVWRDNGTLNGTWSNTSGRLVFQYDEQTAPGEPVLSYWDGMRDPQGPNIFYRWGAGDLEKDPVTGLWLHLFLHPDTGGGAGSRLYTQTATALNLRRNRWTAPVEVNVDSVYAQYPDPSAQDPAIRDAYEPGMWFGTRYSRTGWWVYVPVNPLQCPEPYHGLAIAEAELCPTNPPTITTLSPNTGSAAGGTTVSVNGSNLDCASAVRFDQSLGTIVSRAANQIIVRTPPHSAGTVVVRVSTPAGTATKSSGFTYSEASPTCSPSPTVLCLQNGRFKVEANANGGTITAQSDTYSTVSGTFWFFQPTNSEMMVKMIDGREVNGHFWFYHGALTSLDYSIQVTDLQTGAFRTYSKPANSFCGGADVDAFAAGLAGGRVQEAACVPNSTTACFFGSRFEVRAKRGGFYQPIAESSDGSALFYFFDPATLEVGVKMVDGGPVNGRFWVYYGSMTEQNYQLEIRDTATGATKTYSNASPLCGGSDVNAF